MTSIANSRILVASGSAGLISAVRARAISGAQIAIASCGREVLEALQDRASLSLVLLDADLPGMNFSELAAAARAENDGCRVPVVLLSGRVAPEWLDWVVRALGNGREFDPVHEGASPEEQIDPVTGLYTRAGLLQMLFRETDRVQRMKTSLSLLSFSIDDCAEWKAPHGSMARGGLLRQVVERVRRLLRSYDLFGRIGECEFVLGLPGCSVVNAVSLAERIRAEVFSAPFSVSGASIRLTAGFGVASSEGRSPVVVLREAERELENARAAGPEAIRVSHQRHCPEPWKMQQYP